MTRPHLEAQKSTRPPLGVQGRKVSGEPWPHGLISCRPEKSRSLPYDPRTIAFLCELLHPPMTPDPGPIQKVHNSLFEGGDPLYRSYNVTHEGAILSNPVTRPGAVSSAGFLGDRIQIREEMTGLTVEDFITRVQAIAEKGAAARQLQLFTAQVVTIRTLVNPRSFRDSRGFLKQGMFGFQDEVEVFGQEPQLYGMRMVFSPTQEQPHAFSIRVESFANDPRSLFIENQGTFGPIVLQQGPATLPHGLEPITHNIQSAYSFIVERALPFLARFDGKPTG